MLVPLDWLAEWIEDLPATEVLADRLTMAGLEIEGVREHALPEKVVIGYVRAAQQHPDADRLRVCEVDIGGAEPATIVCGAPNVADGQFVAVATPGTRMPDGAKIKKGKLRGVRSEGMICSESELGLGEGHDGILVLAPEDFAAGKPLVPGEELRSLLPAVTVLEIAITPNRGDCISVLGIARDVAALFGLALRSPEAGSEDAGDGAAVDVSIEATDLCPHYTARVFRVAPGASSPLWMRRRLALAGVRALSATVDLTNYVMLERGQPTHAFDRARIRGGKIVVRRAGGDRALTLLDGTEAALLPDDLVIADAEGPIALAGVMGGADSEVDAETSEIVLESAIFDPRTVRRTARRLGKNSEASFRFERSVDAAGAAAAQQAFGAHGADLGVAALGAMLEAGAPAGPRDEILIAAGRVGAILGIEVPADESAQALGALGCAVSARDQGALAVRPPAWRNDLTQEADLIEEVARMRGFDRIPVTRPRIPARAIRREGRGRDALRHALRARGFSEAVTLSFAESAENDRFAPLWPEGTTSVAMRNPLASVASEMRRSLLPGLLTAARLNRSRGIEFVPLFTAGRVFATPPSGGAAERRALAGVVVGRPPRRLGHAAQAIGFLDWKGIVESALEEAGDLRPQWSDADLPDLAHPGQAGWLHLGERCLGIAGALHPRLAEEYDLGSESVWAFEIDLEVWRESLGGAPQFRALPRYPSVRRDVALVLPEGVPAGALLDCLRGGEDPLVEAVDLFDEYRGDGVAAGHKSLGFAVRYRAADRTLLDEEVEDAQKRLLERLAAVYSFELR